MWSIYNYIAGSEVKPNVGALSGYVGQGPYISAYFLLIIYNSIYCVNNISTHTWTYVYESPLYKIICQKYENGYLWFNILCKISCLLS